MDRKPESVHAMQLEISRITRDAEKQPHARTTHGGAAVPDGDEPVLPSMEGTAGAKSGRGGSIVRASLNMMATKDQPPARSFAIRKTQTFAVQEVPRRKPSRMQRLAQQERGGHEPSSVQSGGTNVLSEWTEKSYAHSKARKRIRQGKNSSDTRTAYGRGSDDDDEMEWPRQPMSAQSQRYPTRRGRSSQEQRRAKKFRVTIPAEQSDAHIVGAPSAKASPMRQAQAFRPLQIEQTDSVRSEGPPSTGSDAALGAAFNTTGYSNDEDERSGQPRKCKAPGYNNTLRTAAQRADHEIDVCGDCSEELQRNAREAYAAHYRMDPATATVGTVALTRDGIRGWARRPRPLQRGDGAVLHRSDDHVDSAPARQQNQRDAAPSAVTTVAQQHPTAAHEHAGDKTRYCTDIELNLVQ
eukprot:SAG11_NODE_128_length_15542_cov_6.432105_9_plen_411_part_00